MSNKTENKDKDLVDYVQRLKGGCSRLGLAFCGTELGQRRFRLFHKMVAFPTARTANEGGAAAHRTVRDGSQITCQQIERVTDGLIAAGPSRTHFTSVQIRQRLTRPRLWPHAGHRCCRRGHIVFCAI